MTDPKSWEPPPLSPPAETARISRRDEYPYIYLPPVVPSIPANWYPDPANPSLMRYWDGIRWTERCAAAAATPQANAVVYNNVQVRSGGDSLVALHIVLTILTCGLWLPIWLLIEIIRVVTR